MLSKGTDLPRPPPTHPEETEEELTETSDMQEDDAGTSLHRCGISDKCQSVIHSDRLIFIFIYVVALYIYVVVFKSSPCFWPIRLQKEGSDDSTPSSERLGVHVKGEEEHGAVHVKGESTESELDEEEEDEDIIQLREGDEEERGGYSQVSVWAQCFSMQRLNVLQST